MSTLTYDRLVERLSSEDEDRLIVTPLLDKSRQMSPHQLGIDVRLGNQFIVTKSRAMTAIDVLNRDRNGDFYDSTEVVVGFGHPFVLHPGALVLGATFEFVALPKDLEASIEGRSSWARLGLIIATAVMIDPGFKGCITLELANLSDVPIKLYPGVRIGQLIFRKCLGTVDYGRGERKYAVPIGPEVSKAHLDPEIKILLGIR